MYTTDSDRCAGMSGARDRVMIRRCAPCAKLFSPETASCSSCESRNLESLPSCGTGSIVSWRVVDRDPTGLYGGGPMTIAIVELDEGPWVYTSIDGELPGSADCPVRVRFQPRPHDDRFPVFEVSADAGRSRDRRRIAA